MKKSFSSYFSKLRKSETLKGARPSQLRLETLEDRQLLSVTDLATVAAANETVEYSTVVASSDAVIDVNSVLNTTATNINNDELVALNSAFQAAFTGQESYFTWNSEGHLTSIDLSNYGVPLSPNPDTVDISGFPALQSVNISGWAGKNGHSKLNLTINESTLTYLNCSNNGLTELDLSNCANLETLLCNDNALTSLDLSAQSKLFTLDCSNNQLTEIEFADNNGVNTALYAATVYGNKFETLDFVKCSGLRQLNVYNAELTDVYLDHSATVAVQLYASGFDAATATDSTGASLDVSAASGYYAFSLGSSVADAVVVDLTSGGEVAKTVKFNQFVALNPTSGSVYAVVDENVDLADITVNSSADERFGVAGYAFVVYNDGELVDNPNSYFEISGSTLKYIGGLASSESVYVVSVGAVGNNGKSLGVADFELTVAQAQLATPSLTDATVSYDTASIIWDAVDYATAYVVSYSYEAATDDPMGGFLGDDTTVVSGTETVTETEFNLGDLDVATTVSFSVVAIRDDMIDSEAATIDVTTLDYPTLTTPTNLSYTATTDTITVTWDAVEGAELYAVLLGDIQDTTSETSYTFTGLDVNTAYDFSVQATGEGAYASEAATLEVQTEDYAQLAAPTNLAYTATTDSITVTWDAVEGAELYAVLLGDIQDTTSETSYTFTGLDVNT
ncbi:MAG: hypothetical protein IJM30_11735, partial [Thermoguttaceae bacterium]|nr:hypothetical protein [Thermoguttaceae bacterium]